jgi:ribose transport system substrate-binding protein
VTCPESKYYYRIAIELLSSTTKNFKEDYLMKGLRFFAILVLTVLLTVPLFGTAQKEEKLLYGMTVRDSSPPYAQAMIRGAQMKAEELGIEIIVADSQNDVLKQLDQLDSFLARGVDGLIFGGTIDTAAVIPGIKKYNNRGVPIMALDNAPEGGKVDLWISFDITESSREAAQIFVSRLKEEYGANPQGVVIEITGALGDAFTNECMDGFHSVIDNLDRIEVVQGEGNWNNEDSFERTSDLLMRYGDRVIGIYVHTPDIMAPGVVKAIEQAGLDPADYFITGICMGPEGRDLIKEGKAYAIVGQPALSSARLAVQYLYDINQGEPIPEVGDTITEEGALWSPAEVLPNPRCEGAFMKLQGPVVPLEVEPDDPRLWENILTK